MKQINQLAGTAVATAFTTTRLNNILMYCGGIDGPDAAVSGFGYGFNFKNGISMRS